MAAESLAGFITTVLPATIAPSAIPVGIASGKFHGEITATTPIGMYVYSLISPSYGGSGRPRAYRRISRALYSMKSIASATSPSASAQFLPTS